MPKVERASGVVQGFRGYVAKRASEAAEEGSEGAGGTLVTALAYALGGCNMC